MAFGSVVNEDALWDTYYYYDWREEHYDTAAVYGGRGVRFGAYVYITPTDRTYSYWEKYAINGTYDTFSCRFAIPANDQDYINPSLSAVLNIYCDDQLVYTSDVLAAGTLPIYIDGVNVSGAPTITLEIVVSNRTGAEVVNDNFVFGWVDPILTRTYSEV